VRDFSTAPRLEGCLRISVGTPEQNDRLLAAVERS
jgi:histidinol-phosphate aminotransferase